MIGPVSVRPLADQTRVTAGAPGLFRVKNGRWLLAVRTDVKVARGLLGSELHLSLPGPPSQQFPVLSAEPLVYLNPDPLYGSELKWEEKNVRLWLHVCSLNRPSWFVRETHLTE